MAVLSWRTRAWGSAGWPTLHHSAIIAAILGVFILVFPAAASEEFGEHWPEGEVAEEVGYFCSACHSLEIIKQQGLDRKRWDDVMQWMIEDHGMPELDDETYARFLDFLTDTFPEGSHQDRVPGRG